MELAINIDSVSTLAICVKTGTIPHMEKVEIKHIADYIKGLEESLYEWDYRGKVSLKELRNVINSTGLALCNRLLPPHR